MNQGRSLRFGIPCRLLLLAAWLLSLLAGRAAAQSRKGFCFLQISDTHLEPVPFGAPLPDRVRGEETFRWLRELLARPSKGLFPARPSFLVVTGDLTEFGFWGRTGELAERIFSALGLPWFALCGNHDETWNPALAFMERRHGGRRYAFEREGCRFLVLPSSTIQEPLPTLDGGDLAWLRKELRAGGKKKPLFLFLHHPPGSGEFARPAQLRLLMDALEGYPLVLLCFGHGHRPVHQRLFGWLDCVEGGTTFAKRGGPDFRGVNVISLRKGRLRVVYRFVDPRQAARTLLDKVVLPLRPLPPFRLLRPARGASPRGGRLQVVLDAPGPGGRRGGNLRLLLDGKERELRFRKSGKGRFRGELSLKGLAPGAHLLTVEGRLPGGRIRQRSRVFYLDRGPVKVLWRRRFEGGIEAAPLPLGKAWIVATLEGEVAALAAKDGRVLWRRELPGPVAGGPARLGEGFVLGCGDGKVYAFGPKGKELWRFSAGASVLAPVLAAAGRVYAADAAGVLHALDGAAGREVWAFRRAGFMVESRPVLWGDLVLFTSWDGRIYALDRKRGVLRWKALGPRSSRGAARYYAPADGSPVPRGPWCWVCDRGYLLGRYDRAGKLDGWLRQGVSAVAGGRDFLVLRTLGPGPVRIDLQGRQVWKAALAQGRIPLPPVLGEHRVYTVSDAGRVFSLEASSGRLLGALSVTPGLYVMAPLALGPGEVLVAAGMDGSVTAVRFL